MSPMTSKPPLHVATCILLSVTGTRKVSWCVAAMYSEFRVVNGALAGRTGCDPFRSPASRTFRFVARDPQRGKTDFLLSGRQLEDSTTGGGEGKVSRWGVVPPRGLYCDQPGPAGGSAVL
jgi:hypothetical protein